MARGNVTGVTNYPPVYILICKVYRKTKNHCLYSFKTYLREALMRKLLWIIIILASLYAFFVLGYAYIGLSDPTQSEINQLIELNETS